MILEQIISLIAPHSCLGCGFEGTLLCTQCLSDIQKPAMQCYLCNKPGFELGICGRCSQTSHIASIRAAVTYTGVAKELVHKMKFERAQAAAAIMADALLPSLPPDNIICPVPTAASRVRLRGYDQAELLAKCMARKSGQITASLLKRQQESRQVGLGRAQRHAQMDAAFRVAKPTATRQRSIVLVDDVITTGATMRAAAQTLHNAGAEPIHVRTFAFTAPK